jgi:hypothetical protein
MALHYLSSGGDFNGLVANEDLVQPGDTILIEPGTYYMDCTMTRPINLKGATTNAALGSVVLTGKGIYLNWSLQSAAGVAGMVWEGLKLLSSNNPNLRGHMDLISTPCFPGFEIVVNKCWSQGTFVSGGGNGRQGYCFGHAPTSPGKLRLINSLLGRWTGSGWYGSWWAYPSGGSASLEASVCQPPPSQLTWDPSDWADIDNGTQQGDYGWGGGSFLWPWADTPNYGLGGTILLASGEDHSQTQVAIYRESDYLSDTADTSPWLITYPDAVTGEWAVNYLPSLNEAGDPQRYAVRVMPPACYEAKLVRWCYPEAL